MKKLFFAAFALAISYGSKAQTFSHVPVSGFNADVVAEGSGSALVSTNSDVDRGNYAFVAQNFVNPAGQTVSQTGSLPNSGLITSAVATPAGLTFQMAPFSGNNSLRIPNAATDTLVFTTPRTATDLYVLYTPVAYTGTYLVDATVKFTDGTSQAFTGITVNNWYGGANPAFSGTTRVLRTTNAIDVQTQGPRMYQLKLTLDMVNTSRQIQSIIFGHSTPAPSNNVLNVFAVTATAGVPSVPNDAGITAVVAPTSPVSAGVSQAVQATLVNQGTAPLTSATITWSVDNVAQTPFAWTGNLAPNQTVTVTVGNYTFVNGGPVVNVCATNPNNATDGYATNDCAQVTLNACTVLSGIYTINQNAAASATNFVSLNAAVTAMTSCGISGSVTLNVVAGSGPYIEQLVIPAIAGATGANTITFNGNGNALNFDVSSTSRAVIKLDGADNLIFNNFIINTNGTISSAFGWGVHFINGADNNTISNNTINIGSTSVSEANSTGIVFSSSTSSVVATGNTGNNNIISGNTINGGYYGITLYSQLTSTGNNEITGNTIKDFYAAGIKISNANGTLVENNNISRPTRTAVSTFEGITLLGSTKGSLISKNRIFNTHGGATSLGSAVYCIYSNSNDAPVGQENIIQNNIIYNINNTGTLYGLYNISSDGVYYYHNTVVLDNVSNTTIVRGFNQSTLANNIIIRNNIFYIEGGSNGAKHALYYNTTTSGIESERNVLFVTGGTAGSGVGYFTSNRASLTDWRTASGDDANSVDSNPFFSTSPANNFTPTNIDVNNIGLPLTPAVLVDINNAVRSLTTPDPGAVEFTVAPLDLGAIALASPVAKDCFGNAEQVTIQIKNWGSVALDFSAFNATVSVTVSGAATQTFPLVTLNSNTLNGGQPLAPGATVNVPIGTLDMTAIGAYIFNATTAIISGGTEGNTTNNAMSAATVTTVAVAGGTIAASKTTYCQSGTPTLTLTGNAGGSIQWQESNAATGPFTNISGATNTTFTPGAALIDTTYYKVVVSCGANSASSNVITINVNNPQVPTVMPGSRCDAGIVTLTATPATGNTIRWYENATGGGPLATGNTYSPTISATTTYYASSVSNGVTENVGRPSGSTSPFLTSSTGWGMRFTANEDVTINTVHVYPTGTGTITIKITNLNDQVLHSTQPISITGTGTQKVPVPVNLTVTAGSYKMTMSYTGITNLGRATTGLTFPYNSPSGALSLTASSNGSGSASFTTSIYYWFYDWEISTGCESVRTPVTASLNNFTVDLGPNTSQCGGNPVILDAGITGATYQWSLNNSQIPSATSQTLPVTSAGSYSVVVNNGGCTASDTVVVTLTGPAKPTVMVAAGNSTTICQGSSVTLLGNSASAGATYAWLLNGTPVAGATAASYVATQAGDYRVIATLGTCSDSSTVTTVTVNPKPNAPVISVATGGNTTICQGGSVTLNGASTSTGVTYKWSLNGSPIAGATTGSYIATQAGNYRVIAATGSCSDSSAVTTITVNPKPATPTITVAAGGNTTFCQGGSVNLTGASATTGVTYTWSRNGAPIAGATAASYTATQAGNYRVIASNGGCTDSSAVTMVTVNPSPATPVISQAGNILSCNASAGNQWYLNGNAIAGATGATFTPTVNGTYTVIVTVSGCNSLFSNSLNVTVTGTKDALAAFEVDLYPNPTTGAFNLNVPAGKAYDVTITDLAGRIVKKQAIQGNTTTLQLSAEAKGIYLVIIRNEANVVVKRLLVE